MRLIKYQEENGYTSVVPQMSDEDKQEDVLASPLKSTYVKNGLDSMPKCGKRGPWRPRDYYFVDRWRAQRCDLNDGLKWEKVFT